MRHFPFPTWEYAVDVAYDAHQFNGCISADSEDYITEWPFWVVYLQCVAGWLGYHMKHWRCVTRGHRLGPWIDLYGCPEVMDDTYVSRGMVTGQVRNCKRCDHQTGRGEY